MAKARYFCIATKTSVTTDANDQIVMAPETNVYLYQSMDIGVKSILYLLWLETQKSHDAENNIEVDAETNTFRLTQNQSNGNKRTITWTAVPYSGVKNQNEFEAMPAIDNKALDFVSLAYAGYEVGRKAMVNGLLDEGETEDELRDAGVTPDEQAEALAGKQ